MLGVVMYLCFWQQLLFPEMLPCRSIRIFFISLTAGMVAYMTCALSKKSCVICHTVNSLLSPT